MPPKFFSKRAGAPLSPEEVPPPEDAPGPPTPDVSAAIVGSGARPQQAFWQPNLIPPGILPPRGNPAPAHGSPPDVASVIVGSSSRPREEFWQPHVVPPGGLRRHGGPAPVHGLPPPNSASAMVGSSVWSREASWQPHVVPPGSLPPHGDPALAHGGTPHVVLPPKAFATVSSHDQAEGYRAAANETPRVVPPPMTAASTDVKSATHTVASSITPASNNRRQGCSLIVPPLVVAHANSRQEEYSSLVPALDPCGPKVNEAHVCFSDKRQVNLARDLRERLVKRRRTEDLDRPPGIFDLPPGDWGKTSGKTPAGTVGDSSGPPGDWGTGERDRQDRSRRRRVQNDMDRNHKASGSKVRYADHCRKGRQSRSHTDSKKNGHADKQDTLGRSSAAPGIDNAQPHAPSPSSGSSACIVGMTGTAGAVGVTSSADTNRSNQTAKAAPWRIAAPSQVPPPAVRAPWHKDGQEVEKNSSTHGLLSDIETDLLNEINKVTSQPDIGELLSAVDQVAPEIIASSPDNEEDESATESSGTEDTDYDPFDTGADGENRTQPCPDDDEDGGIVEALFEMMRGVETSAPDQPLPATNFPDESSTAASASADSKEKAQSSPQKPSSSFRFNSKTQRWEPKKEPALPESKNAHAEAPARISAIPIATIDLSDDDEKPKAPPRQNYDIAECEAQARADWASGGMSYPQALAVRLVLRFESKPADMLAKMEAAGLPAAKDQRSTVKAIMRLCHPDKCKHSLAKRAMQALVPLLS